MKKKHFPAPIQAKAPHSGQQQKRGNNIASAAFPGLLEFRVPPELAGTTLQTLLSDRLGISRNKAKSLLDQRRAFVNNARVWMAHHRMRAGDRVEVCGTASNKHSQSAYQILDEDESIIIINKPCGIKTTGAGSLEERLRQARDEPELLAVHRLDQETTGCWLVARNAQVKDKLVNCFMRHEVQKFYHALVRGLFPTPERTIKTSLDGLTAVTHVKRLDAVPEASHLLIRIQTGRTHQIRRHLSGIGHPILGDSRYAGSRRISALERSIPRHMLHASEIRFPHPITGRMHRVAAALPDDFRSGMHKFGLH